MRVENLSSEGKMRLKMIMRLSKLIVFSSRSRMRVCRSLIPRLPILYEHLCVVWRLFHTKDTY